MVHKYMTIYLREGGEENTWRERESKRESVPVLQV